MNVKETIESLPNEENLKNENSSETKENNNVSNLSNTDEIGNNTNQNNSENLDENIHKYNDYSNNNSSKKSCFSIFSMLVIIFVIIVFFTFSIFSIYNMYNSKIILGVYIKGVNVSNLSVSDAKYKLDNYFSNLIPEEIKLTHGDFETTVSTSQIEAKFDTKSAAKKAFEFGRQGNFLNNDFYVLNTMFNNINIEPFVNLDEKQLQKSLNEISSQLPDAVKQSSYYIEGNNLIVTAGKDGFVVDVEATIDAIRNKISSLDFSTPVDIVVKASSPEEI